MPSMGRVFADRVNAKMIRVFQKLADPCIYLPVNAAEYSRLVSLDDNGSEIAASSSEWIPQLIMRAEFLLSEGEVQPDDTFTINGNTCRLTQRVSLDAISVTYIYITL